MVWFVWHVANGIGNLRSKDWNSLDICSNTGNNCPVSTGARIAAAMERKRVSFRELSKRTGLHVSSLHRMVHGTQDVSTDKVVLIADALDVRASSLLPDSDEAEARAS